MTSDQQREREGESRAIYPASSAPLIKRQGARREKKKTSSKGTFPCIHLYEDQFKLHNWLD